MRRTSDAASRRDCRSPMPTAEPARYFWTRYRLSVPYAVSGRQWRHTDASARALVEGKGLSKWFEGSRRAPVRAVENVSFAIPEREVLVLSAKSGSGKSTLGRLALPPAQATVGAMLFDGQDLAGLDAATLAGRRGNMADGVSGPFRSLNARMTGRCRAPRGHCPAHTAWPSERHASEPGHCCRKSGCRRPFSIDIRARARAVSASVLRLPAHWRPIAVHRCRRACVRP